jgi:hypothetical protein
MILVEVGETATMAVQVKDATGALGDAGAVPTFVVIKPDTTTTVVSGTTSGTGLYQAQYTPTAAGRYVWTATATGGVLGSTTGIWSDEFRTQAIPSAVTQYAATALLRERMGISGTANDVELTSALVSSSRDLEQYCRRVFTLTGPQTRTFAADDEHELCLREFSDLATITTLETDDDGDGIFETSWSATDYELGPLNAPYRPDPEPWTNIVATGSKTFPVRRHHGRTARVRIGGTWGWTTIPESIPQANLILAAEIFKTKDAPFGIVSFGEFGAVRVRANPMVARMLDPYSLGQFGSA